ncbi:MULTISPECIES: hypothetical protein [Reichenbachiella]|nr:MULTISPECIES: hypothetical protein [Reichenbachiella]MBU2913221.1 hypothetical protein [Reichenbachiella agariperforans]RJE74787.1 hypothetical protein BGP76_16785 [Reichenbachiella sp. MSK19-1]
MKVNLENISDPRIKDSFMKVMEKYFPLHTYEVTLKQKPIKTSTMQAQPVITFGGLFTGVKRYRIKLAYYVRDSENIKVSELPDDVLTGWFAHELGHVMDYAPYSNWQMIGYGFKYVFSKKFRKQVEYKADYIAIDYGFHKEIVASKRFILNNDMLEDDYKDKISTYYMSIEEVRMCVENKTPIEPTVEL